MNVNLLHVKMVGHVKIVSMHLNATVYNSIQESYVRPESTCVHPLHVKNMGLVKILDMATSVTVTLAMQVKFYISLHFVCNENAL